MKRMFAPFLITIALLLVFRAFISNPETSVTKFFEKYGYSLSKKPIETSDFTFPATISPVLKNYEQLQNRTNLSIIPYLGKTVKRYTYEITNVKGPGGVTLRANALIYKNKVVAADIMTVGLNGFMAALCDEIPDG